MIKLSLAKVSCIDLGGGRVIAAPVAGCLTFLHCHASHSFHHPWDTEAGSRGLRTFQTRECHPRHVQTGLSRKEIQQQVGSAHSAAGKGSQKISVFAKAPELWAVEDDRANVVGFWAVELVGDML